MKKTITLTSLFTAALLTFVFTTASAFGGDEKCGAKCCKEKKEVKVALAELQKSVTALEAELDNITVTVTAEVKHSLAIAGAVQRTPVHIVAFASVERSAAGNVAAKDRINFSDLSKEMDIVQESMTTPVDGQKIDFTNLQKEMDETQKEMSRMDSINS